MQADFQRSLRLVLIDEGGCDDDPHDHGGRTAHGIIQREFDGYCARKGIERRDVWAITPAEYTEIYHDQYWEPWCDRLPAGLDYAFFDACVNAGPAAAARLLQRVLKVRVDGHIGEATLGRLSRVYNMEEFIHEYCDARRAFYRALAQFPRYGRGWLARVDHVERAAKQIAVTGQEPVRRRMSDDLAAQATARAKAEDTKEAPITAETGAATTTVTTIGATAADTIGKATDQLSPVADAVSGIKYVLIVLTIASICLTVYAVWHSAKMKEATT